MSLLCLQRKVLYEFQQKCFKTTKRHSVAVCGSLCGEKKVLLILPPFTGLSKNSGLNKSKFSSGFTFFQKMVRKKKFLSISVLGSEIVTFMSKRKYPYEFNQKSFKTTERNSLALCGSLCGEKQFLLIFIPFNWFDQKYLFKQIQIFLRICHFSNIVRKTNFLSIYVLVSAIATFMSKKKCSL